MGDWSIAELTIFHRLRCQSIKSIFTNCWINTSMWMSFHSIKHFLNQIIYEKHLQFYAGIIYCDWKIISDVIAESTYC